jgi:hypothetical protein
LKQQIWKNEKNQKECDGIYDMLKKRMEMEKLRVSQERLEKHFCLIDNELENDNSNTSSSSTD